MRIASKVDLNQPEIVRALRQVGARVQVLSMVGQGCPDLLVYYPACGLVLMELKDGAQPPSKRRLTPDEERWHEDWQEAPLHIILSVEDALKTIGAIE